MCSFSTLILLVVKIVARITYTVLVEMLNHAQSINIQYSTKCLMCSGRSHWGSNTIGILEAWWRHDSRYVLVLLLSLSCGMCWFCV